MSDIDINQTRLLSNLKTVNIRDLSGYQLDKLLFSSTYTIVQFTFFKAIKECIKRIVCNFYSVQYINRGQALTLITYNYRRNDHTLMWNRFKKLFNTNDYNEILIEGTGFLRENLLSAPAIISSIAVWCRAYKDLHSVEIAKERIVLASVLGELVRLDSFLSMSKLSGKVAVQYFDGASYENLIVQKLRGLNIKTAVLQHGQPFFHGLNVDRINQAIILNFSSDYIIVPGDYARKQCEAGGISASKIVVLGTLRPIISLRIHSEKKFIVFLDCPTNENSKKNNLALIKMAEQIALQIGFSYTVKVHPQDTLIHYSDITMSCGRLLGKKCAIEDSVKDVAFSLLHASGVYLDMLALGVKSFCLHYEGEISLVGQKLDLIISVEDFLETYYLWNKMDSHQKKDYWEKNINYYLSPQNSQRRHVDFIKRLGQQENEP